MICRAISHEADEGSLASVRLPEITPTQTCDTNWKGIPCGFQSGFSPGLSQLKTTRFEHDPRSITPSGVRLAARRRPQMIRTFLHLGIIARWPGVVVVVAAGWLQRRECLPLCLSACLSVCLSAKCHTKSSCAEIFRILGLVCNTCSIPEYVTCPDTTRVELVDLFVCC